MLKFFNIVNDNKLVKEGAKVILDSIRTNHKLFAPMLTREFTLEESHQYDSMSDEKFNELVARVKEHVLVDASLLNQDQQHDPNTHVKIRLLHNQTVSRENEQSYDYAIIHFHGGGFVCQDSSAH